MKGNSASKKYNISDKGYCYLKYEITNLGKQEGCINLYKLLNHHSSH